MAPLPPVRKRKDYSTVSPNDLTFALFHDRIAPHDAMRAETEDAIGLGLRQKAETYGGVKRSNLDENVFAGPDRSFPIKTAQDVKDAVMSLGRTKHDKAAVKKGIIRRARAIGAVDALPEDWKTEKAQTAQDRAMFANMGSSGGGGGGGAGGKASGGQGGLWKKGPSGKRTPQAGPAAKPSGGGGKADENASGKSDQQIARERESAQRDINDNASAIRTASNEHRDLIRRANAATDESEQNKLYAKAEVTGGKLSKLNAERERLNKKFDFAHAEGVNRARAKFDEEHPDPPSLPQALREMTPGQHRATVTQLSKLPLSELRRRQDLVSQQKKRAWEYYQKHGPDTHNDRGAENLDIMGEHLRAAIDKQVFGSGKKKKEDSHSFTVLKSSDGAPDRWLAITTTAYEDKDREIISRNAIKEAVALGDSTGKRGPLLFWHVPGLVMGDCDFQAQGGPGDRFLLEGGTFRNKAMASLGQKLSDAGYQMSPGFIHTDDQPSNGVYDHILIYERSAVPANRAANYFTRYATAKEDKVLAPEKIAEYREKAAGNAEALAMLDSLLATAQKDDDAAQARNVVYKEAPEEITIGGVVYTVKAFPPAAAEEEATTEEEVVTEEADDGMAEAPEMETEAEEVGMDDAEFAQLIARAVVEALTPLLDIEKKMASHMGELKTALGGFSAQKDDAAQAQTAAAQAQAAQIAALDAKVKELSGDLPTSVMNGARNYYRASESIATQLTPQAAATVKEAISNVPAGLTDPNEIAAYKLIFG